MLRWIFWILLLIISSPKVFATTSEKRITEIRIDRNDSVFKYSYLYDQQKRVVLETRSLLKNNDWVHWTQTEWGYSLNDLKVQIERRRNENSWNDYYSIDYQTQGNTTKEFHYTGSIDDANLVLTIVKKVENELLQYCVSRKKTSSGMVLTDSVNYEYQQGKLTTETHRHFTENGEQTMFRFHYNYNEKGNVVQTLHSTLKNDSIWENLARNEWFYKPHTTLVSSQRQKTWNKAGNFWENSAMTAYVYDSNQQLTEELYYYWNLMVWERTLRYEYAYNQDNQINMKLTTMPVYGAWRNTINVKYSDLIDYTQEIESVYGFWGGETGKQVSSHIPYSFNGEMRIANAKKLKITYSEVNSIKTFHNSNKRSAFINVYPNPASGVFYYNPSEYELESWEIYNLSGQSVMKNYLNSYHGVIDLSHLPDGIYFMKAKTAEQEYYQKLIKK